MEDNTINLVTIILRDGVKPGVALDAEIMYDLDVIVLINEVGKITVERDAVAYVIEEPVPASEKDELARQLAGLMSSPEIDIPVPRQGNYL